MATNVDVLVVGAGLSGICAGYYLQKLCPEKTFAILEGRDALGGTWELFSYPGVRSDSDIITLSYSFKEWDRPQSLAGGPEILAYLRETADQFGITEKIRFGHRVTRLEWSSNDNCWAAHVSTKAGEATFTANYIIAAAGYYNYEKPYLPEWPGQADYKGTIAVPQFWPKNLDYTGKKVAVIGSGATSMTVVPAMSHSAGHVTMIQRSPTYTANVPTVDPWAKFLRRWLPLWVANRLLWLKNVMFSQYIYKIATTRPKAVKHFLIKETRKQLPEGYDVKTHFTPRYDPWKQRLCAISDGDLYKAISDGKVSVETSEIEKFTEKGILLKNGREVEADIVVPATGLTMNLLNGFEIVVDGKKIHTGETIAYKSVLLSGIPNFTAIFGYINSSWTLKAELICKWICRLLNQMSAQGYVSVTAVPPPDLKPTLFPYMESGYFQRAIESFPKEGDREPWKLDQNYYVDLKNLWWDRIGGAELVFAKKTVPLHGIKVEASL